MDVHSEHVRQLWRVVGAKRGSLPGQLGHPGSHGGPTQCPGSSVAFTGPCAAGFTRARQTDPLYTIKPSTREQRGQVLGPALSAHLHPAGEQTASSQAKRLSIVRPPLTRHQSGFTAKDRLCFSLWTDACHSMIAWMLTYCISSGK